MPTPKKPKPPGRTQSRATIISAAPLSIDELVTGVFQISPADVKKVLASKSGGKKK